MHCTGCYMHSTKEQAKIGCDLRCTSPPAETSILPVQAQALIFLLLNLLLKCKHPCVCPSSACPSRRLIGAGGGGMLPTTAAASPAHLACLPILGIHGVHVQNGPDATIHHLEVVVALGGQALKRHL